LRSAPVCKFFFPQKYLLLLFVLTWLSDGKTSSVLALPFRLHSAVRLRMLTAIAGMGVSWLETKCGSLRTTFTYQQLRMLEPSSARVG
jgi:hypothetical protein